MDLFLVFSEALNEFLILVENGCLVILGLFLIMVENGLEAWMLKFWPDNWLLHLCLGCVGPLIGFVHGVNGRVVAWGSMIRAVGDND